jgi:hypothetical protein
MSKITPLKTGFFAPGIPHGAEKWPILKVRENHFVRNSSVL